MDCLYIEVYRKFVPKDQMLALLALSGIFLFVQVQKENLVRKKFYILVIKHICYFLAYNNRRGFWDIVCIIFLKNLLSCLDYHAEARSVFSCCHADAGSISHMKLTPDEILHCVQDDKCFRRNTFKACFKNDTT